MQRMSLRMGGKTMGRSKKSLKPGNDTIEKNLLFSPLNKTFSGLFKIS